MRVSRSLAVDAAKKQRLSNQPKAYNTLRRDKRRGGFTDK